jgi:DNA-binding winged helix-turn-helix (wHTH) protein
VELDASNRLLSVDGRPRICSSKVLELLLLLCRSPETLLSREYLMDALWPGGQVVADEALTKVIFHARNVLGPYGEHIRTVRSQGLSLDAKVVVVKNGLLAKGSEASAAVADAIKLDCEAPTRTPPVADLPQTPVPAEIDFNRPTGLARLRPQHFALLAVAALLLLFLTFVMLRPAPAPIILDEGFGLLLQDLHALQPESANMLVEAFQSDEHGERARAILLLKAIHRSDTATPVPALFLAFWLGAGAGHEEQGIQWLEEADRRIGSSQDVYLNLLRDYVAAEIGGTPEQIVDQAGALLDIRPNAWRMRTARAHLLEFAGMREAALQEVQQIQVTEFTSRQRNMIIADRAAFGDVDGAQAMLDRIPPESDPMTHAFLNGRVAWSRGDLDAAHEHFRLASDFAYSKARMDIFRRSLMYMGAIDVMQGRDLQAAANFKRMRVANAGRSLIDEIDLSLFLAQLSAEAGDIPEMRRELDRALQGSSQSSVDLVNIASYFVAWRLDPEAIAEKPSGISAEAEALWRGMEFYVHGEKESSSTALAEAQVLGINNSRLADEARWLELQLGQSVTPEKVLDPPFPPLSRAVLRRQIRNAQAEHVQETGALQP